MLEPISEARRTTSCLTVLAAIAFSTQRQDAAALLGADMTICVASVARCAKFSGMQLQ